MRMNLNQQSSGSFWEVHKNLMRSTSPIVDCGVHYVDVMCQVTRARPVLVHAIGARLTPEIAPTMVNYGHLHIVFSDGSVGWYEAGWGPMMSEIAFFVKDMIGPEGAVSIVATEATGDHAASADHAGHTRTGALRLHHAALKADGSFARADEIITTAAEPDHQGLCDLEQKLFLAAIRERARPFRPSRRGAELAAHRVRGGREHPHRRGGAIVRRAVILGLAEEQVGEARQSVLHADPCGRLGRRPSRASTEEIRPAGPIGAEKRGPIPRTADCEPDRRAGCRQSRIPALSGSASPRMFNSEHPLLKRSLSQGKLACCY